MSSGSDGNATYIETESARILVDAGISSTEIAKRLALIGVTPADLDAIVITHEHSDHIKGLDVLSSRYDLPIFADGEVWVGLKDKLKRIKEKNIKTFTGDFEIKDLLISPVEIPHDVKCFGFSFLNGQSKASILTDLGHTNEKILNAVKGSSLVYLESNHDIAMLKGCSKYPLSLKMRILGPHGHLSNDAAADFAKQLVENGTRQIVLSHLSKNTNTPELAYTYTCQKLAESGIIEGTHVRIDVALTTPVRIFKLR